MSTSKLRIGKDITIKMSVLTNGESVSLDGRDISIMLKTPMCENIPLDFSTEGNVITTKYEGIKQKCCGMYMITVWENYGKIGQTALDFCNAFELVSSTCKEVPSSEGLELETVNLDGDLAIGVQGPSAYDIAVANGFKGTEEEWLASLHGEPGEAGPALTYDDLTDEQKAELARPGIEAADGVKEELNDKITHGVNLLLGSDTTLLDSIGTWQMTSATIAGKQNDGWWRVNIPNGTTDGEIFIEENQEQISGKVYTQSVEIKSDGPLTASVRFHRAGYDYEATYTDQITLNDNHYRIIGTYKSDGYGIRPVDIQHINAPNSTYIDVRFPILSQTDDYVPWQPSIYDLTEMRQEVLSGGGSSLDDAPSDGNTYGRKDGEWSKTVGKVDPNSDGTSEIFNNYTKNSASGKYSHAEGSYTKAIGDYSHAEGASTQAWPYSHAEGCMTIAQSLYTHAEGYNTIANSNYAHAEGTFNISNNGSTNADKSIHIVGIGSGESNRKNAHEIMWNGDHYIYGIGGYNGKNYSEAKTLQKVITELTTQVETLQTTINELKGGQG